MSDEILELRKENIELKKFIEKLEGKIVELEEKNGKLLDQNAKLLEENNSLRAEKSQENTEKSHNAIQNLQPLKRSHEKEVSSNLLEINKKPKFTTKRFVPNWLIEVMEWIKRIEMANSALSTSCATFKQICWPKLHLNVKPHKMPNLECSRATYEVGKWKVWLYREDNLVDTLIPIASIPPPNYIIGIGSTDINILDERIMNFAKCTSHLFENCHLKFNSKIISCNMDNAMLVSMKTLMASLADKIYQIDLWQGWQLNNFDRLFPGVLENAQFLGLYDVSLEDIDIILNWLKNRSNIGKQKIIQMSPSGKFILALINGIKMEFINSNLPSIFLIGFRPHSSNIKLFRLENEQTNEILTLYWLRGYCYLARYPKGEGYWKEEGRKKMEVGHGKPILQRLKFSHK